MDDLILILLVILAVAAVRLRDLLGATAVLGAYSLVMAILWCSMSAVDVGFTEAAVGAGISTVLMLAAISRIGRHERPPEEPATTRAERRWRRAGPAGAFLVCVLTAGLLLYGARDMPEVGAPDAPATTVKEAGHPEVAVRYVERSPDRPGRPGEVGPPNIVTSVLGDYRGYDTLGETVVIFTAALCVVLLLRQAQSSGRQEREPDEEPEEEPEA